jgi:hypothetical protein
MSKLWSEIWTFEMIEGFSFEVSEMLGKHTPGACGNGGERLQIA